jgi:hypothetical protein
MYCVCLLAVIGSVLCWSSWNTNLLSRLYFMSHPHPDVFATNPWVLLKIMTPQPAVVRSLFRWNMMNHAFLEDIWCNPDAEVKQFFGGSSFPAASADTPLSPEFWKKILFGGLEHEFYCSIQLGIILPTDFHLFQRGWNHQPEYKYK